MSIILKSLGYETPDGTEILSNINLTIEQNKKYGLVGPNGVGKSTLARIIMGELTPTSGFCKSKLSVQFMRKTNHRPANSNT